MNRMLTFIMLSLSGLSYGQNSSGNAFEHNPYQLVAPKKSIIYHEAPSGFWLDPVTKPEVGQVKINEKTVRYKKVITAVDPIPTVSSVAAGNGKVVGTSRLPPPPGMKKEGGGEPPPPLR